MHASPTLSREELALFNELLSSRFGLYFPEHKRAILESRLSPRLRANHVQRFIDYYLLLHYDLQSELDPLTRAVTNNESYFFREVVQFEGLRDRQAASLTHDGALRCLSAGCSSGEEPYTLNLYLRQSLFSGLSDRLRIDAFDLDSERLDMAERAVYRQPSLRAVDAQRRAQMFETRDDGTFELRRTYRYGVQFSHGNILDLTTYPSAQPYDVIFCRNVLIYFSEAGLKTAIDLFARALRPGGLLFLGHSESIIGLTRSFQAERVGGCIAYRRSGG